MNTKNICDKEVVFIKVKKVFVCQECGNKSPKWLGKCPVCNSWNTFTEEQMFTKHTVLDNSALNQPVLISDLAFSEQRRHVTGISEFDRVLGGGAVPGSLVLIGGDPGIGKSTLLLQVAASLSKQNKVIYISGEESLAQIGIRSKRLHIDATNLYIVCETDIEAILSHLKNISPKAVIIDSIQTMTCRDINSVPGSIVQIRETTIRLMHYAKKYGTCIFIIGHVTKEGTLAGPKILEHMVDTVLYFEGERHQSFRILRTVKNRFGSTNEVGIFEMCDSGLKEVLNPSSVFIEQNKFDVPGSVIVASIEGTRPILVEIQALVTPTSFGMPRRMTAGVDQNRVALIMAVLEKRVGLNIASFDAYVNVVGGVKLLEPAVDLAIATALASSFKDKPVLDNMVVIGEIGLTGEIRQVSAIQRRLKEACKMGIKKALIPSMNIDKLLECDMDIYTADTLKHALEVALKTN
ncbi:MAG: DNA repair protein RadA [Desulfotomaculum sp.]|nr:DNA repair protein RadA [Desulfotomaculum sp.]